MSLLPSLHSRELLLYAYRSDGTASRSILGGESFIRGSPHAHASRSITQAAPNAFVTAVLPSHTVRQTYTWEEYSTSTRLLFSSCHMAADGVRGCTPTVLLWRDPKLFWGSGDGPVGALLVVAGSTGHRVVAVAGFTTSLLQSNIPPLAMPAGDAEHATRQLWRHYSGVQSSSPVSGAVGAVGGSGGGQGLVCGISPD